MIRSIYRHPVFFLLILFQAAVSAAAANSPLLHEGRRILLNAKDKAYTHTTHVVEGKGIFHFDCSGFIDYALGRAVPERYTELVAATKALSEESPSRPLAKHFVRFIEALETGELSNDRWLPVTKATSLRPGDILSWLMPEDIESKNTGHVMLVRSVPRWSPFRKGELAVDIIDSTASGHGKSDPRKKSGPNGLGEGTVGLVLDGEGHPLGYRWSIESKQWHETPVKAVRLRR